MLLTEKLEILMKEQRLNKRLLAHESGIPYTTITSLFSKGYENAKLSTLKGLANFFGVTLDSLCRDELMSWFISPSKIRQTTFPARKRHCFPISTTSMSKVRKKSVNTPQTLVCSGKYKKCSEPELAENA